MVKRHFLISNVSVCNVTLYSTQHAAHELQVEQAYSNTSTLCQHFIWGPLTATIFILCGHTCMVILLSKHLYSMSHECILYITETTVFLSFKEQIKTFHYQKHHYNLHTLPTVPEESDVLKTAIPCLHSTVGLCPNKPIYVKITYLPTSCISVTIYSNSPV